MESPAGDFGGEVEVIETDWDSADEVWTAAQGWRGNGMHVAFSAHGSSTGDGSGDCDSTLN